MQGDIPRRCLTSAGVPSKKVHLTTKDLPSIRSHLSLRKTLTALALALFLLFVAVRQLLPHVFSASALQSFHIRIQTGNFTNSVRSSHPRSRLKERAAIPNIVHFVHLVTPSPDPQFDFPFHQFIAIYSAYYYLHPETIYIHTNVEGNLIENIVSNTSKVYTQALSKVPVIRFKYHQVKNETSNGRHIDRLAHQSDFVRTEVLKKYGGIYLDDDSYVLRDLGVLRRAGFENIVGMQDDGRICSAVILATPHNELMTTYDILQEEVFDGTWDKHSVRLLATLAREFSEMEHQVLVVPQDTFFPLSWNKEDLHTLYDLHEDDEDGEHSDKKFVHRSPDFTDYFDHQEPDTWRRDWRSSYVLHGWHSGIKQNFRSKEDMEQSFGRFGDVTLEYVLGRNSNFARAVYPAVKNALDLEILEHVRSEQD